MWLTRFALTRPVVTAMVFFALSLFGFIAYFQIGRSQNPPGTEYPLVYVAAFYPGASPQEMEKFVVKPLEDQLNGVDNVDRITATTQEGEAEVNVIFKIDTNIDLAAIDVQRRVDTARVFMPSDLDPPVVGKAGSSEPLMTLAVSSKSLSQSALGDLVQNQLQPVLRQLPNIQEVNLRGVQTPEFHVDPDPARLLGVNATLNDVFNAVASNNALVPGGRIDRPTSESTVSIHADILNANDIAMIPLPIPGESSKLLHVGDVAKVSANHVDQRYISKYNGEPRVRVQLLKDITADEISTTKIVREKLKGIEAQFPQLTFHEIDAPADYTQASLTGVWQSLGEGILLTAIVMLLFLHAWRNAVVVMIAIPVSIFSTFIVMRSLHFTFDFMSLMGLSLIIGILVDDSIVVLENITRHRDLGEDPKTAAINGRSEIGGAAVAITMVDVIVFLPIAFMPGLVGKYLKEFGLVVVVATLFSLLVSFTLTPLFAAYWSVLKRSEAPPAWLRALDSAAANLSLLLGAALFFTLGFGFRLTEIFGFKFLDPRVLGVFCVAILLLNLFVHRYDRVVDLYRTKVLPFALSHGYYVVFACALLFLNAIALTGGGSASASLDVVALVVLGLGMLLGLVYRGAYKRGTIDSIDYMQGSTGYFDILVRHAKAATWTKGPGVPRFAAERNAYRFLVRSAAGMYADLRMTIATFAVPLALAAFTVFLPAISTDFVPSGQTGSISMTVSYPAGTPIKTTSDTVDRLSSAIMKIDGIDSVSSTVGYKPSGFGSTDGGNYAVMSAETKKDRRGDTNKIIEKIRTLTYLSPGAEFQVAGEGGGGSGTPIFYALQGPDDVIDAAAKKVVDFLRATPGSVNVQSSAETGAPRLNVQIDREKATLLGVAPGQAATAARLAIGGGVATKVRTPNGLVDVRVQFPAATRNDEHNLELVRVRANDGTLVPLASIATFAWTIAPTKVERLNRQRVVNVTGGVLPNVSLGSITGPLEKKLSEPGFLPAGVHLEAQGDTQLMIETFTNMALAILTSFLLVYILMVILYGSFIEPFIVMFSVPMAVVGALFSLVIMHVIGDFSGNGGSQSLNIISMIGIIMLFGLVAKNGILLVDYSNTLVKRGMRVRDAVQQAAATRFRPILMTTFAMVFGMLPLALGFAEGAEWRQAMGTVIIGGLISSLVLTLFLVPMIYNTWIGFIERVGDRKAVARELEGADRIPAHA